MDQTNDYLLIHVYIDPPDRKHLGAAPVKDFWIDTPLLISPLTPLFLALLLHQGSIGTHLGRRAVPLWYGIFFLLNY
jgi:hypothetical protein